MASQKEEKVVFIPLKDIVAETGWNSRSGDPNADSPEESTSYKELFASIKASNGMNKDAIKVRPKGANKFSIVYGFSRFSVVSKLAEGYLDPKEAKPTGEKVKDPVIKCIVEELDELEARAENMRENVAHRGLKASDSAFGIMELKKQFLAKGITPTDNALTDKIGMNQSYGNKLLTIMQKVKPAILNKWRTSPLQLSVPDMIEVSRVDHDRQQEVYDKLFEKKDSKPKTTQEKSAKAHESDKKTAAKWAAFLGKLEREDLIDTANLDWVKHLDFIVKLKSDTPARRAKVAQAAEEAYQKAFTEQEAAEGEEEEDEDED